MDARITNTQTVKDELKAALDQLRRAVQFEPQTSDDDVEASASERSGEESEDSDAESWHGFGSNDANTDRDETEGGPGPLYPDDEDGLDALSDGWESGSVDSSGRVVASRDDGAESGEESSDQNYIDAGNLDDLGSASSSSSPPPQKRQKTKASQSSSGNIFLPSLAGGFLPGEADPNDDWENFDVDGPVRKNRRGQRARRL